jgi:hypothetical protein
MSRLQPTRDPGDPEKIEAIRKLEGIDTKK